MITELVMNRIRQLLLAIVGVLKRAMCCFSRRRKLSAGECEVLSTVSVDRYPNAGRHGKNVPEKDWNSWDDSPKTVEEHIERYRETLAQPPSPTEPQPEMDYFQDMAPQISSQPKICIATETEPSDFSRLVAKIDIPVVNELEDWNEGDRNGWDDADETTTKQLIRETRKELRAQRHQNRHQLETSYA
ncbi:receptor-binding cancer antigen expressed on SiSo cells [Anopheles moucheti]|uniref:receptor-binding cancer antigen expressed on SiSo cells n=1 Tax=Anopheles moucheti TaxID=186751 RepID=UPI0022F06469|nr:receptor-binding cancer antigen expressed on SiSo cells [Anopheles moucheti]XP_053662948.1 receptor-binding cancer antigen expressed on SiSo cells [Anopheles marshallii]